MGNCVDSCFGSVRRKSNGKYFTGRYKEYNVGIEFESLIEDDLTQQSQHATVTDRERDHLLNQRYSDLIQDQRRKDAEIDAELQRQEENIRLEEEAYIAAKRESSRAAHQARALQQQRSSKPLANGTAKSSWLGENESEWHVAGGEDDFEMFLESVKARSETVRANGMTPNPYNSKVRISQSDTPVVANVNLGGNAGGSVSTQEPTSSEPLESDSDFEPEFVGAETVAEQAEVEGVPLTNENTHAPLQIPLAPQNPVTIENTGSSKNHNAADMLDTKLIPRSVEEASGVKTNGPSLNSVGRSQANPSATSVIVDKMPDVAQESTNSDTSVIKKENNDAGATESSAISTGNLKAAIEDDPFDFDRFLEELDL